MKNTIILHLLLAVSLLAGSAQAKDLYAPFKTDDPPISVNA